MTQKKSVQVKPGEISASLENSSPLPSPEWMAGYEQAHPGSFEKLLEMADRQLTHVHSLQVEIVKNNFISRTLGQIFAVFVAFGGFGIAGLAIYYNQPWIGALLGSGVLGSLVSVFLKTSSSSGSK